MPANLSTFGNALINAAHGSSQNAFERALRALGIGVRASEARAVFKIARTITIASPEEVFRPIEQAPSGAEIGTQITRKATGIRQNVSLVYRDKTTGTIKQTFWSTVGSSPLTREEAIATAIDAYSEHAEQYNQDLIGAVHTSAYNLVPGIEPQ